MGDYKTTGLQDHRTNDDAAARRGQRSVVSGQLVIARERSVGEAASPLAELLVSMGVLVLLVLLFTQLVNSAATITILGHKRMDADSQARQVFDRMAVDFAQMLRRKDVDYYGKLDSLEQTQQKRSDGLLLCCTGLLSVGLDWHAAKPALACRLPGKFRHRLPRHTTDWSG